MKMQSPKNKFRVEINFSKAIIDGSHVASFTTNDLNKSQAVLDHYLEMGKTNGAEATVVVKENKKTYPAFDWQEVEKYVV